MSSPASVLRPSLGSQAAPPRGRGTALAPVARVAPLDRLAGSLIGRNPVVRRMLLASFVSGCGDRLHQVALAALILALTNSLASAGLVFVVSTVPYALFGLPLGAMVDRWDRRTAMIAADLVRALTVLAVPAAAFVSLPLVYPLLFGLTCATMVFTPARQAAIPDAVAPDDLPRANILFQAVNYLVDLLVLPLAGVLVAVCTLAFGLHGGAVTIFSLDALSYLASAVLLLGMPRSRAPRAAHESASPRLLEQVVAGLRFLFGHPRLRTNTLLLTVGPLLLGSLHTLWIGFAWRVSNTQTFGYAVVEMANAAGTLAGLWLMPRVLARIAPGHAILLGFAVMGGSIALAGTTASLPLVAALAAGSGLGNMLFLVPSITLVQHQTPPELRGRVFAVRYMLTFGAFGVSNALVGGLADAIGVSALLLVLGSGMVLVAAVACLLPSARDV